MRRLLAAFILAAATASAQQPFTLQQILSAPYALALTAAPVGNHFAWIENAEGRRNIWIAAPNEPARQLTHYTEDDGQDISNLTWSPDATQIAYTCGAENGASGRPANPAHLQHPTPLEIFIQPVNSAFQPTPLTEGRFPLFTHDGNSVLFIRSGQIFITCLKNCHPEPSEGSALPPEAAQLLAGVLSVVTSKTGEHTAKQLVFDRGTASQLTLSPDGKLLAYVSHRRSSDRTHTFIALFNLETKTLTFPAPSTGNDSAPIFSPDGKQLAWLRSPFTDAPEFATNRVSAIPWSIQLADLTTNTTRTVFTPEPNKPGSVLPRMSTGEPRLYWTASLSPSPDLSSRPERSAAERPAVPSGDILFFSEADGWVHLYAINPTTSVPPKLLTPNVYEVEDPVLSPDGKQLFYSANGPLQVLFPARITQTGKPELHDTPSVYADRRSLFKLDLTQPSIVEQLYEPCCSIFTHPQVTTDGILAALVSDELNPMHPELADFSKGSADTSREHILLHPEPFTDDHRIWGRSQPQELLFNAVDGVPLHGQLFLPPFNSSNKAPLRSHPAIIFVHGGPRRQMLLGYPSMDYYSNDYAMNQYLASRGYIVLSVNYRGGIGYGLNFRQCEHCGADGAAEYADVLAAAAYLRSRPDVDAAHIGIWGGSYGGYLTALALARNSDIFAAGVDFHGVHEWSLEDNAKEDWLRGPLADQGKIAATAHASSPMADIARWRSPILLIHGDDDPEVAYAQTPLLADALRARNIPVEELIFPDEVHDFLLHKDWLAAYEAAANFFDRTLKPSAK